MSTPSRGSQKARDTLEYLRERITSEEWRLGDLIPKEPELMELIGVGKSTVREAVRSLATLGMLETIPGVGTFVRARTPVASILSEFLADQNLEEVLIYRRSLEIEAAQSAAVHRTSEQLEAIRNTIGNAEAQHCISSEGTDSFHRRVVEASGSNLLLDLYNGVMNVLHQAELQEQVFLGANLDTLRADHEAVYEAIEQQDVRDAAHSMALHVDRDLGLSTDTLDFYRETERMTSLRDAGYDPSGN
ncbi:MAG: FadR/GntR family transcriptional regulator [Canibacter sp.]